MKRVLFPLILVLFTVSNVSAGLDEGLVVYFTFDNVENGRILDASGNDLHADVIANTNLVDMGMPFILPVMPREQTASTSLPTLC